MKMKIERIRCSNCNFLKDFNDIVCYKCGHIESKDLDKMYANRLYGKCGLPNEKILYTDTDSIITISNNCSAYWDFKGIKFPCQLKAGHLGMHINNPKKKEHVATILW